MTKDQFYNEYIPSVLDDFFNSENSDHLEAELPGYVRFLQGSRYGLEPLRTRYLFLSFKFYT
jgi:hypothetical protein